MKRPKSLLFYIVLGVIAAIAICYIGIPSRLINKNISQENLTRIKEVNKILMTTRKFVKADSLKDIGSLLPDAYNFVQSPEQIDKLFYFLKRNEKQKIKDLITEGIVMNISLNDPECIEYEIKTSRMNYFLNSSWETLYIIFDHLGSSSRAEKSSDSEYERTPIDLGQHWFKITEIEIRKPIRC